MATGESWLSLAISTPQFRRLFHLSGRAQDKSGRTGQDVIVSAPLLDTMEPDISPPPPPNDHVHSQVNLQGQSRPVGAEHPVEFYVYESR